MRLETKFVQVENNPRVINAINELAAVWGWSVQSVQVTDNKVAYEGNSYGWTTDYGTYISKEVITEHTNYASITYQRDMDHPNYAKLCALEEEYNTCDNRTFLSEAESADMAQIEAQIEPIRKKYKKITIITTIATIYTAPAALFGLKEGNSFGAPLLIAAIALFAAAIMNGRKTSNATPYSNESWNKLRKLNDERRAEHKRILIQQASKL